MESDRMIGCCVIVLLCTCLAVSPTIALGLVSLLAVYHLITEWYGAEFFSSKRMPSDGSYAMQQKQRDDDIRDGDKIPNPRRKKEDTQEEESLTSSPPSHRGEASSVHEPLEFTPFATDMRTQHYRPPDGQSVHRRYESDAKFLHLGNERPPRSVYTSSVVPYNTTIH